MISDLILFNQMRRGTYRNPGPIVIIGHSISNMDGIIQAIDEPVARVLKRTRTELIGMSYTSITHPEDIARNVSQVQALRPNGQSQSIRKRYLGGDGSIITLHVQVLRIGSGETRSSGRHDVDRRPTRLEDCRSAVTTIDLPHSLWRRAKDLLAVMQARDRTLGGDLFADHAWALLLSVYVAEAESRIATARTGRQPARSQSRDLGSLDSGAGGQIAGRSAR